MIGRVPAMTLAALLVATAATPAQAHGEAPLPTREGQRGTLSALLRAPEAPRVDAETLRRIGPDVPDLLVEVMTAPKTAPQVRARSLGWLQHYPDKRTWQLAQGVLAAPREPVVLRRAALRTLARAFGARAVTSIKPSLDEGDVAMREAAAFALGDIDHASATRALQDRLGADPSIAVRDAIVAALQRIEAREKARKQPKKAGTRRPSDGRGKSRDKRHQTK
jgi:hypothetical protein